MNAEVEKPVRAADPDKDRQRMPAKQVANDAVTVTRQEVPEHLFSEPTLPCRRPQRPQRT